MGDKIQNSLGTRVLHPPPHTHSIQLDHNKVITNHIPYLYLRKWPLQ